MTTEPRGAVSGTGTRPYIAHAPATPTSARASAIRPGPVNIPCETGGNPTTGARKSTSRSLMIRNAPAPTDPMARMIIGHVITAGDSCGCARESQRLVPNQVMSIIRVM